MSNGTDHQTILTAPQRLTIAHELEPFDCGIPSLDDWLKRRARRNEQEGASRTYVVCMGQRVVGYYCLATGSLLCAEALGRVRRNMPDPIPVMILGRLAVDRAWQGQGLGSALLRDAVLRILNAAEIAGVRAILVHAISEEAKRFYESRDFMKSPMNSMTLVVTLKDIREAHSVRVEWVLSAAVDVSRRWNPRFEHLGAPALPGSARSP